MADYKLVTGGSILRALDGASIPPDMRNSDYRVYLDWVDEGNTADPADVEPVVSKEDRAENRLTADPALHALVKALAGELSITTRQLLDKIRTQAR